MKKRLFNAALRWIPPSLVPKAWQSAYEAANWSPRRGQVPGAAPADTSKELTLGVRTELVRQSRYLVRNSGFVREMVGSMAIYSTGDGISPQAQSSNPKWNRAAEEYFRRWAARCEVTERFSFAECQSLVCRGIDIDGEYFVIKTRDRRGDPRLQLIETHRVGDDPFSTSTTQGIALDEFGAPVFYRLLQDDGKWKDVPASSVLHIFEPESASAVRHAPVIQHSINHLRDEMELLALEKHAVKDNADIARVLKTSRAALDESGDFSVDENGYVASDVPSLQRIMGGKLVALKPDESLDTFQSNRPSATFTGFLTHLRRDSALGVMPFEFAADSSALAGAGVRLIVAKADRRFSFRQLILIQRLIKPVWAYVIADAIARKLLPNQPDWHRVRCQTPKRVTVDAGREAQQNRADVEVGLKTLEESYAELGMDFEEQAEVRAQNARLLLDLAEKYNLPLEMMYRPSGGLDMEQVPEDDERPPPPAKQQSSNGSHALTQRF